MFRTEGGNCRSILHIGPIVVPVLATRRFSGANVGRSRWSRRVNGAPPPGPFPIFDITKLEQVGTSRNVLSLVCMPIRGTRSSAGRSGRETLTAPLLGYKLGTLQCTGSTYRFTLAVNCGYRRDAVSPRMMCCNFTRLPRGSSNLPGNFAVIVYPYFVDR